MCILDIFYLLWGFFGVYSAFLMSSVVGYAFGFKPFYIAFYLKYFNWLLQINSIGFGILFVFFLRYTL